MSELHLSGTAGRWRRVGAALALVVVACLAACGGGGGSDSVAQPMSLDLSKADEGTLLRAPMYIERLAELAHLHAAHVTALAVPGRLPGAVAADCSRGGSRSVTWDDSDGNGVLSAGDLVGVHLAGCYEEVAATHLTGDAAIVIERLVDAQHFTGVISWTGTGMRYPFVPDTVGWTGRLRVTVDGGVAARSMQAESLPGEALRLTWPGSNVDLSSVLVTHRANELRGQVETTFSAQVREGFLGGSYSVTTPQPLVAIFNIYPSRGNIALTDTLGNSLSLLADSGEPGGPLAYSWKSAAARFSWDGLQGFFSWSRNPDALLYQYSNWILSQRDVEMSSAPQRRTGPADRSAELWFSKDVSVTPGALPRLRRLPDVSGGIDWGSAEIACRFTVSGNVATVTWDEQLQPGRAYELTWLDASGVYFANFTDAGGGKVSPTLMLNVEASVTAALTSRSDTVVLPYHQIRLDATASRVPAGEATYAWRQLSGPPVNLSSASGAATIISTPSAPGVEPATARLELKVTATDGTYNIDHFDFLAVPDPRRATVYRVVSEAGEVFYGGRNSYRGYGGGGGLWFPDGRFLNLGVPSEPGGAMSERMYFRLPSAYGGGQETHFVSGPAFAPTATVAFNLVRDAYRCDTTDGQFTISELMLGDGLPAVGLPVVSAAVDFQVACNGGGRAVGALRVKSAIPIPE